MLAGIACVFFAVFFLAVLGTLLTESCTAVIDCALSILLFAPPLAAVIALCAAGALDAWHGHDV